MKILVTDEIKNEAVKHSEERMNYEYNRFNLEENQRFNMILIGTIGQLCFKKILELEKIEFIFEYQAGNYDKLDFKINEDIIEVKTSGFDDSYHCLNLLYSADQYISGIKKKFKYCVQMFINGYNKTKKILELEKCTDCIIAGFIEFEDISKFKQEKRFYGDDYKIPLNKLKDISLLINSYKRVQNGRKIR